jgi:hypothetical protein
MRRKSHVKKSLEQKQQEMRARTLPHIEPRTTKPQHTDSSSTSSHLSYAQIAREYSISHDQARILFHDHAEAFLVSANQSSNAREHIRIPRRAVEEFFAARKRGNRAIPAQVAQAGGAR